MPFFAVAYVDALAAAAATAAIRSFTGSLPLLYGGSVSAGSARGPSNEDSTSDARLCIPRCSGAHKPFPEEP